MTSISEAQSSDELLHSRRKDENFETYSVIWLDGSIDSRQNINAQEKLRSIINYLQTFQELDECEKYIRSVPSGDRIVFIVSGHFGQQIIPNVHQLQQVFSIYIYCVSKQFHGQWSKQYHKVRGVHNQLDVLISQMQFDQAERKRTKPDEPLSMSILDSPNMKEQSTIGLDGRFVQSQLLVSCLLKMKTTQTDKTEFLFKCRQQYEGNKSTLKIINEFEKDYVSEYSLWWYAKESFLYRSLNKALRIQNIDLLFLFRFFIRDIAQQLYQNKHPLSVRVYRGQLISIEELNILKNSKGKFISMHSFLSTSFNRAKALFNLCDHSYDNGLERVLFEIEADPNLEGVRPFADLSKMSCFDEEEILMMLGSVFCLKKVYLGENQIWHIEMNLCSDNACGSQNVVHHMKYQYSLNNTELLLFANVLIDMANFDDAAKYLIRLLKQLPLQHKDIYKCYHALGKVCFEKGYYDLSLNNLYEAVAILKKFQLQNPGIGFVYNSIGEVYQKKGDTIQALEAYKKALTIFEETFDDKNCENIAWCYNNIGTAYQDQKNYSLAFEYLMKALNIKNTLLPPEHPCLSNTYNNLGNVHYCLGEYDQAMEKYRLSYEIFKKSLAPGHPSIARLLKNIGGVYEVKGDLIEAKKRYEKASCIREKLLTSTHPDMVEIKEDIARVSSKI